VTLYLDTSSVVKLYVAEAGSDGVRRDLERADIVATSVVTYAETRAALARLRRERALTPSAFVSASRAFHDQWSTFVTLDATEALCRVAGDLAERYRLRGFDSIHLASYVEVMHRAGVDQTQFSSFDADLNGAARTLRRTLRRRP
jgi:predicted nucleic acid-binding protein